MITWWSRLTTYLEDTLLQVLVTGLELIDLGLQQLVLGVDGLDRARYLAQVRLLGLVLLMLQLEAFVDLCRRCKQICLFWLSTVN